MATPTYATALSQINTFIVANGNNEITANVLNPVLKIILDFANNNIGDLNTLTTDETNTIVEAINSLKQNFEDLINNGVQLHTGYDDPNITPPADYNYGDFYMQLDSGDDSPIQLWQWNGFEWKDSSSNPATNSDNVENNSDVVGQTVTDALNNLLNSLPNEYTKVVYVNNNNPNSATIFDLNNPPTVNDNLLKSDVNNLYIGLDASTWVYNATSLNYVTKTITSATSNFYLSGTTTDAGNSKTANIYRLGYIGAGAVNPTARIHAYEASTGNNRLVYAESNLTPTSGVTMNQGIAFTQLSTEAVNPGYSVFGYNVNPQSSTSIVSGIALNADTGTVPSILMQGERVANTGSSPSVLVNRPVFGISNYSTRLATVLANGNFGINIDLPTEKLEVTGSARINGSLGLNTAPSAASLLTIGGDITGGLSASGFLNQSIIQSGVTSNAFYNRTQSNTAAASFTVGTIFHNFASQGIFGAGSTVTNQYGFFVDSGMTGAINNRGFVGNIVANASNNFNAFMSGTAPNYFNGTTGIGVIPVVSATNKLQVNGNITANVATAANHVVVKSQLDLKADNLLTGYVSGAGTVAGTDTVLQAIQKLNGNTALKADITALPTSGTFTPTASALSNVTSVSVSSATYTRVGNIVTARYGMDINITSANTPSEISLTFPINRSVTTTVDIGGGGFTTTNTAHCSSTTVNLIRCVFQSIAFGTAKGYVNVQYSIN